jgi:hypothetical protein
LSFLPSDLDQSPYMGSKSFESLIQITKYGLGNLVLLHPSFMFDCKFLWFLFFPIYFLFFFN